MVTIPTRHRTTTREDIEVSLKFDDIKANLIFNKNTPDIIEQGLKKWFKREMRL